MQTHSFFRTTAFALLFLSFFALTSCDSEGEEMVQENPTEEQVTSDEAAEILEVALQSSSQGMAEELSTSAALAEEATSRTAGGIDCGETRDTSLGYSVQEPNYSAEYSNTLFWTLNCNQQQVPQSLTVGRNASGAFETMRMLSQDTAAGNWTLTELLLGPSYIVNGSYSRMGVQTFKVGQERTVTSSLLIEGEDIYLDKGDQHISSGEAEFTLSVQVPTGESFTFSGDIIFLGDGAATLIINGKQYTIDIY